MSLRISKKLLALVLAFCTIISTVSITAFAANSAVLNLSYPKDVDASKVAISVYSGFPTSSNVTISETMKLIDPVDGKYTFTQPGTYSLFTKGDDYYQICKLFNVSAADLKSGTIDVLVDVSPLGKTGYEPSDDKLANIPKEFVRDGRDNILAQYPDELLKVIFPDINIPKFNTPAFTDKTLGKHEFTSQGAMEKFIKDLDDPTDNMYTYSIGELGNYKFDIPMVIFTNTKIPAGTDMQAAAKILEKDAKPIVWHEAQIHANETASGEAALFMIAEMDSKYGEELLKDINVIVVPRINPEGSYLYTRTNYDLLDMNRDHLAFNSEETYLLHKAYNMFLPEMVLDGHEFTYWNATVEELTANGSTGRINTNIDDIEITPASSLNNNKALNDLSRDIIADDMMNANAKKGLRVYHYGTTSNNAIGRAYFGLMNSISVLVETRGIGAGRNTFERRIYAQVLSAKSMYENTAKNADLIVKTIADARAEVIRNGKTYNSNDVLVLEQNATAKSIPSKSAFSRPIYNFDGTLVKKGEPVTLYLQDTAARTRIRPTAYVIPKDMPNIEKVLRILDGQNIEFYSVEPNISINLSQYFRLSPVTVATDSKDYKADLRVVDKISFEKGAYMIPMDQITGNVIGMLFEPDVTDSAGYNGTFVQQGIIKEDAKDNFPIYRYTGNNPRVTLAPALSINALKVRNNPSRATNDVSIALDATIKNTPAAVTYIKGAPLALAGTELAKKLGTKVETVTIGDKNVVAPIIILDENKDDKITFTKIDQFYGTDAVLKIVTKDGKINYAMARLIPKTTANKVYYTYEDFIYKFAV